MKKKRAERNEEGGGQDVNWAIVVVKRSKWNSYRVPIRPSLNLMKHPADVRAAQGFSVSTPSVWPEIKSRDR